MSTQISETSIIKYNSTYTCICAVKQKKSMIQLYSQQNKKTELQDTLSSA